MAALISLLLFATMPGVIPLATADQQLSGNLQLKTQSGKMRCEIFSGQEVACESGGFPQAPTYPSGGHWPGVSVNSAGDFKFVDGDLGQTRPEVVLEYGQTYHLQGWTILPTSDGTRFINDATGHGMFVSIENAYSF